MEELVLEAKILLPHHLVKMIAKEVISVPSMETVINALLSRLEEVTADLLGTTYTTSF